MLTWFPHRIQTQAKQFTLVATGSQVPCVHAALLYVRTYVRIYKLNTQLFIRGPLTIEAEKWQQSWTIFPDMELE